MNPADSRDELRAALEAVVHAWRGDTVHGEKMEALAKVHAALAAPAPTASLDAAWAEAETAIATCDGAPGRRLEVAHAIDQERGKYRAWAIGLDTEWGPTPAAALLALAERLREQSS